jgi:hypothetical protein
MPADNWTAGQIEYFRALRTEIIEAQKLRVQIGLAKTVFHGTLLGYFLKERAGDPSILICPIVALMFDCMVYGLSFNIRDVGSCIGERIERDMGFETPWQTYRTNRRGTGFKDWGRFVYRVGSYGLSVAVTLVAFVEAKRPAAANLLSFDWIWRIALLILVALSWGALILAEFPLKRGPHRAPTGEHRPSGG